MADIKITDAEFAAFYGLPALAQLLYLYLRRRMDFSTGLVGSVVGVSWWALREDLHVDHARGRHRAASGTPTEKAVRNAVSALVAAGLVQDHGGGQRLLFFLPMAARGKMRPNDEGRTSGRHEGQDEGQDEGRGKSRASSGRSRDEGQDEGQDEGRGVKDDEGHTSGFRGVLSNSVPSSSSIPPYGARADDASADVSDIPDPPTEPGHWLTWFNRLHGTDYSPTSLHDRKRLWPVLQGWVRAGITQGQMNRAVGHARATATGPIGNLALYCASVLDSLQAKEARAGADAKRELTYRALTGAGKQGRVIDGTASRMD